MIAREEHVIVEGKIANRHIRRAIKQSRKNRMHNK
jgi:hypothetical protein